MMRLIDFIRLTKSTEVCFVSVFQCYIFTLCNTKGLIEILFLEKSYNIVSKKISQSNYRTTIINQFNSHFSK